MIIKMKIFYLFYSVFFFETLNYTLTIWIFKKKLSLSLSVCVWWISFFFTLMCYHTIVVHHIFVCLLATTIECNWIKFEFEQPEQWWINNGKKKMLHVILSFKMMVMIKIFFFFILNLDSICLAWRFFLFSSSSSL